MKRVNLIKKFYLVKLSEKNEDGWAEKLYEWAKFQDKWRKISRLTKKWPVIMSMKLSS